MEIEKPIFIVGVGRSGSTVFHHMFSRHPNVLWLSGLCGRFPGKPSVNKAFMKAIDCPIIGSCLRRMIHPGEAYDFWAHHFPGFVRPCRDLFPGDVTNKAKARIRNILSEMLTDKRSRLLVKIAGFPRIGFLHEIFDDAKFIHILRDGRAVANSMMNTDWWQGWEGPQGWRWGQLVPSQKEEWERYDKSFVALAGIQWKILMDAMERAKGFVSSGDFLEVRYERLCSDPSGVFKDVLDFCDLKWLPKFEKSLKKYTLRNSNHKWQEELTVEQQSVLESTIRNHLTVYGYLSRNRT